MPGSFYTVAVAGNGAVADPPAFTDLGNSVSDWSGGLGGWTAVNIVTGTVDILANTGGIYDASVAFGTQLGVEPASGATRGGFRVDDMLATGEELIVSIRIGSPPPDAWNTNNSLNVGISFSGGATATYFTSPSHVMMWDGAQDNDMNTFIDGVQQTPVIATMNRLKMGDRVFFRAIRDGDDVYFYYAVGDVVTNVTWIFMITFDVVVEGYTRMWFFIDGIGTYTGTIGGVSLCDWVVHKSFDGYGY